MSWKVEELNDNLLRLLCVDGIGGSTIAMLEKAAGGLAEAGDFVISGDAKSCLPRGACDLLRNRMRSVEVQVVRRSADASKASLVVVTDDDFPKLLKPLPACPASLWFQGDLTQLDSPAIAIVGARRCTTYGIEQARDFARAVVESKLVVVSGGARGIDAAAHRASILNGGKTCAVLGSGLQVVYPPEHVELFNQIVTCGGLMLSEFPCQTSPRPANFPRRNRIISGLTTIVVVIEAAKRSGAMITARISVEEHGREAYVVPGRVTDECSAGCLQALADGWVHIAVEPVTVIEEAIAAWNRFVRSAGG